MRGIYHGLCVNCEGAISDERLLQLGVCEKCVEKTETLRGWDQLLKVLKENGRLYFAEEIFAFLQEGCRAENVISSRDLGSENPFKQQFLHHDAHECIRPTRAIDVERLKNLISLGLLRFPKRLTQDHFQLYDLIFKRFIASQMREARLLYQKFRVLVDGNETYIENPVGIVSEGFNIVLPVKTADPMEEGEYAITFARLLYVPAARPLMQGEVIALMREKGIGRPSTYAKIVSTILERNAIERKNRLISTALGFKVYMYLQQNFGKYTSEETTRRLESLMDLVEQGKANYNEILKELYQEILEIRKAS